jgi:hypothetical protein
MNGSVAGTESSDVAENADSNIVNIVEQRIVLSVAAGKIGQD